jgi:hypothetical protein
MVVSVTPDEVNLLVRPTDGEKYIFVEFRYSALDRNMSEKTSGDLTMIIIYRFPLPPFCELVRHRFSVFHNKRL